MPEVTCPNCGLTINLENRREIDYDLIMDATRKPATFTELLHATKLSRKTLSMRLKELCSNGAIVKGEGVYTLNGHSEVQTHRRAVAGTGASFSKVFRDRRVRAFVWMLMLVTSFSLSGYVLAMYLTPAPQQVNTGPAIMGYSTMAVDVSNVTDLYSWEVAISFNATELKVLQVEPGSFWQMSFPLFLNSTDIAPGFLLVGGTLEGDMVGRSGSGTLATIVFGCFTSNYTAPLIVPEEFNDPTCLIDSRGASMPIGTMLSLKIVG